MITLRRLATATVLAAATVLGTAGIAHAGEPPLPPVPVEIPCPPQARAICDVVEELPTDDTPWG